MTRLFLVGLIGLAVVAFALGRPRRDTEHWWQPILTLGWSLVLVYNFTGNIKGQRLHIVVDWVTGIGVTAFALLGVGLIARAIHTYREAHR